MTRNGEGRPPLLIACGTISAELELALKETGRAYPVRWIDSGLHLNPADLRARLQEELDEVGRSGEADTALMAFGFCGNALVGLCPPSFRMILPRADDCITILLGSRETRRDLPESARTYFMTKGWLDCERNIWAEYQEYAEKRGRRFADRIYGLLLAHYRKLGLIDTGAYDFPEFYERTEVIGTTLGLSREVIPGDLRLLRKLLTGPWDHEFVVIQAGETVSERCLYLDGTDSTVLPCGRELPPD